eukprot:GAHX01000312.1.p1 GENE.GAHX01000312.1~~GAHX01000312.1.p1  ORF type:complete len:250 (+),score=44.35 GAHX01000312.1:34-750(+)
MTSSSEENKEIAINLNTTDGMIESNATPVPEGYVTDNSVDLGNATQYPPEYTTEDGDPSIIMDKSIYLFHNPYKSGFALAISFLLYLFSIYIFDKFFTTLCYILIISIIIVFIGKMVMTKVLKKEEVDDILKGFLPDQPPFCPFIFKLTKVKGQILDKIIGIIILLIRDGDGIDYLVGICTLSILASIFKRLCIVTGVFALFWSQFMIIPIREKFGNNILESYRNVKRIIYGKIYNSN